MNFLFAFMVGSLLGWYMDGLSKDIKKNKEKLNEINANLNRLLERE